MLTSLSSQPTTIAQPGVRAPFPHTQPTYGFSPVDALPKPSCLGLNIPEMDQFDNDELDINPVLNASEDSAHADDALPLLGALLVAEGLVTREQLKACLLIQAQDHPGVQLGQIMLRLGYISASALDRVVELQQDIKASLIHRLEARTNADGRSHGAGAAPAQP